jgi:hypothetical protein
MANVLPEHWNGLEHARAEGTHDLVFTQAWNNGRFFLEAADGLRGRIPLLVEWKGPQKPPGYDSLPIDLRIDHVFLVSCKYLSGILGNPSPEHLFDELLASRPTRHGCHWYEEVAPKEYHALYRAAKSLLSRDVSLPSQPQNMTGEHRTELGKRCARRWPEELAPDYKTLCKEVSRKTAARWEAHISRATDAEALLWRMLRFGSAPYFVLGSTSSNDLRVRIATPWDWRQLFVLRGFHVFPQDVGQPQVGWEAKVKERATGQERVVSGHVEIRWSHGRFCGHPEAKVYLDSAFTAVPGYLALE